MARKNTSGRRQLDELVLRELESLERAGRSPLNSPERLPEAGAGVVFLTHGGEAGATEALVRARHAADEMVAEEANPGVDSAGRGREPIVQPDEAGRAQTTELFDAEEAAFVARSVEWLQGKPSKDMILSQIWVQLQESEPDGFFAPAQERTEPGEETPPSDTPCSSPHQEP